MVTEILRKKKPQQLRNLVIPHIQSKLNKSICKKKKKISLYLAEKSMLELLLAWQLYTALKGEAEHPGNKTLLKMQTAPKKDPKALKNL